MIDANSVNHPCGDAPLMVLIEALVAELGRHTALQSTLYLERIEQVLSENNLVIWED